MRKVTKTNFLVISTSLFLSASAYPASAQQKHLPKAGFSTYSGQMAPSSSGLSLTPGLNRTAANQSQIYNPGEPSLNMSLCRWDTRRMPLLIWISPGLKLPVVPFNLLQQTRVDTVAELLRAQDSWKNLEPCPGWTPDMNMTVANGIEQWREFEQEGLFSMAFVDDPKQANILIFFADYFEGAAGPGGTNVNGNTCAKVYPAEKVMELERQSIPLPRTPVVIELKTNTDSMRLQAESAHEFGHALGIKAHSPYREDIMYENRISNFLSPADKATVRYLYKTKPAYFM